MDQTLLDPQAVAEKGEQLYRDKFKGTYEPANNGWFLAIDVASERAYLGKTADEAYLTARKAAPAGIFHLIKIGSPGAFRISYSTNGDLTRLFR